jgi:hypothetical protein
MRWGPQDAWEWVLKQQYIQPVSAHITLYCTVGQVVVDTEYHYVTPSPSTLAHANHSAFADTHIQALLGCQVAQRSSGMDLQSYRLFWKRDYQSLLCF